MSWPEVVEDVMVELQELLARRWHAANELILARDQVRLLAAVGRSDHIAIWRVRAAELDWLACAREVSNG